MSLLYYVLFWLGIASLAWSANSRDLDLWLRAIAVLPLSLWLVWTWLRGESMKTRIEDLERKINERKDA